MSVPRNKPIIRQGDMGIDKLALIVQEDGDVVVTIRGCHLDVEFCAPSTGGGKSPKTWRALHELAKAMVEDNE